MQTLSCLSLQATLAVAVLCSCSLVVSTTAVLGSWHEPEAEGFQPVEGVLTLLEASSQRLQGQFFTSSGRGVSFDVDTGEHRHSLTIHSTQSGGRVLATQQDTLDSTVPMLISLFDNHFLVSKDKDGLVRREYLVPKPFHRTFEPVLFKHVKLLNSLKKQFDEDGANETRSEAIGQLLASEEASLVIQAAKALGNRGVQGPAAMMFYILALRMQALLDRAALVEGATDVPSEEKPQTTRRADNIRHSREALEYPRPANVRTQDKPSSPPRDGPAWIERDFCSNSRSSCRAGECPHGKACTGLCGTACSCWEWVCGNCCLNKMCLDHDNLCSRDGMLSWCCLGIVDRDINPVIDCKRAYTC